MQAERPVERRTAKIHGYDVSYRICGDPAEDRPVLLLVHGMAGSATTWRSVMPSLGRHHTVIAPDLLGHGTSSKPRHDYSLGNFASLLRDLLIALGVERATLVGHSLGGGVVMQLAYQHPERCERLVLVCSGGLGKEVSWILRALTLPASEYAMPILFPGFVRDVGNAVSRWLGARGIRAPHLEEEWRSYVSLTEPDTRAAFVRTLRGVIDVSGQTVTAHDRLYLARHVPTLIIWGAQDHIIPVSHAHAAHAALPGSRLEIFDDAGHFPHAEQPQKFIDVLDDFVESTEPMRLDPRDWHALLTGGPPQARR
ncbi:alpha/beta fold hydrolase [Rhabdothermincola sp.]|uniref:alpha/beta fold hydrolase n=1 Tax=Rhabdothermincola sp. TaxID=2820405 RepID=UPI002FE2D959